MGAGIPLKTLRKRSISVEKKRGAVRAPNKKIPTGFLLNGKRVTL
jgi:hypothetical protein